MSSPAGLDSFLNAQKAAREERALEKKKENAVLTIQRVFRGFQARKIYRTKVLQDLDDLMNLVALTPDNSEFQSNVHVFLVASRFLSVARVSEHPDFRDRFEKLCKYIIRTVETSDSAKFSYIGVALNKKYSREWIRHIKIVLGKCCESLQFLKPESHMDSVSLALQLHTLIVFTSPNTWLLVQRNKQLNPLLPGLHQMCDHILGALVNKGFFATLKTILFRGICRNNVCLKPVSLVAILSLSTRPLTSGGFADHLISQFMLHILTVPALVHQIETLTPDYMAKWTEMELLSKCIQLLANDEAMGNLISQIQGTQILALLANLIHLFNVEPTKKAVDLGFPNFTVNY